MDNQQRVVFQLGDWVGTKLLSVKSQHVMKSYTGPQTWQALVNMVMNLWFP
jgi:hypothetical protein